MKIGLYQDPRGAAIGGAEYCLAVLARALRREGHAVELVHHQAANLAERMSDFFQIDLTGIEERVFPIPGRWDTPDVSTRKRVQAMRGWMHDASAPYEIFVCITHSPPPFNHAPIGLLYVLFPFFDRWNYWPWNSTEKGIGRAKAWWRQRIYERWWCLRMRSYTAVASISEFTRVWTKSYWGTDSRVIFPPVDVNEFTSGAKEDRIQILGRFTQIKKQLDLVAVFKRHRKRLPDWVMACAGGLAQHSAADREYFNQVQAEAHGVAQLVTNAPREQIRYDLSRSRVFWHAMGIDVDEAREPTQIEHFGIATVEAMAAGCIPIVVNRGGQREIVTHGETGFLCNSFDEFADWTVEVAANRVRAEKMAAAARDRVAMFALPVFEARMLELLRPHLTAREVRS